VLDRLLLAALAVGLGAGAGRQERQRYSDRGTDVNSFSHRDTNLSSK
jgi:hypothetical protein